MKKIFVAMIIMWLKTFQFCSAQDLNRITINLSKDTFYSYTDARLEIKIDRADGQYFLFPKKYGIGNETQLPATLVYILEKLQNDTIYQKYLCKYINIPIYNWKRDTIQYAKMNLKVIIDSLSTLECIDSGSYRLRVLYNKIENNGILNPHNFTVQSNLVYFHVFSKELLLSRYRIDREKKSE